MASFLFSVGMAIYVSAWIAGVISSVILTGFLRKHRPQSRLESHPTLEKSIAFYFRRLRHVVTRGYADSSDSAFVSGHSPAS